LSQTLSALLMSPLRTKEPVLGKCCAQSEWNVMFVCVCLFTSVLIGQCFPCVYVRAHVRACVKYVFVAQTFLVFSSSMTFVWDGLYRAKRQQMVFGI